MRQTIDIKAHCNRLQELIDNLDGLIERIISCPAFKEGEVAALPVIRESDYDFAYSPIFESSIEELLIAKGSAIRLMKMFGDEPKPGIVNDDGWSENVKLKTAARSIHNRSVDLFNKVLEITGYLYKENLVDTGTEGVIAVTTLRDSTYRVVCNYEAFLH